MQYVVEEPKSFIKLNGSAILKSFWKLFSIAFCAILALFTAVVLIRKFPFSVLEVIGFVSALSLAICITAIPLMAFRFKRASGMINKVSFSNSEGFSNIINGYYRLDKSAYKERRILGCYKGLNFRVRYYFPTNEYDHKNGYRLYIETPQKFSNISTFRHIYAGSISISPIESFGYEVKICKAFAFEKGVFELREIFDLIQDYLEP